jgi:hypothetical protein
MIYAMCHTVHGMCLVLRITWTLYVQVCQKDVKHEYTAILNHLRVKHNMTLTLYTHTYIKPELAGALLKIESVFNMYSC